MCLQNKEWQELTERPLCQLHPPVLYLSVDEILLGCCVNGSQVAAVQLTEVARGVPAPFLVRPIHGEKILVVLEHHPPLTAHRT